MKKLTLNALVALAALSGVATIAKAQITRQFQLVTLSARAVGGDGKTYKIRIGRLEEGELKQVVDISKDVTELRQAQD